MLTPRWHDSTPGELREPRIALVKSSFTRLLERMRSKDLEAQR
jgi:hypothetical protein